MTEITVILGIATGVLSVLTFLGGALAYIKASARKEYASERDIGHLKNHLSQMTQNVEELWKQTDRRFDFLDMKLTEISLKIGVQEKKVRPPHQIGSENELD